MKHELEKLNEGKDQDDRILLETEIAEYEAGTCLDFKVIKINFKYTRRDTCLNLFFPFDSDDNRH